MQVTLSNTGEIIGSFSCFGAGSFTVHMDPQVADLSIV